MSENEENSTDSNDKGGNNELFNNFPRISGGEIDPTCIHSIKNRLVRIQYPGIVNNVDKAIENLGGMSSIEKAVEDSFNKLQLNYHPANKYNKGCIADCDSNNGLLLKVKVETENNTPKYSYTIEGITMRNFVFNKLIDFQYLPLVAEFPETADSKVENILDTILPSKLSSLNSVLSEQNAKMALFLPPVNFSCADTQKKLPLLNQNTNDEFDTSIKKKCKAFIKEERSSIFHKFTDPNVPNGPNAPAYKLLTKGSYKEQIEKLEKLFQNRPIWTRQGVMANTKLSYDSLKYLLPTVAYYVISGPWRCSWIRFGYDPRKDPEARRFQNLDYRLPGQVRSYLHHRNRGKSNVGPTNLQKLEDDKKSTKRHPNSYILKPKMVPNSKQVFYQYCDILIPEIQTMMARLPPVPPTTKCDFKNGWFPTSFIDQCREIVNKYVDEQATNELQKNKQNVDQSSDKSEPKSTDFCSLMIKNVKRGLYTNSEPSTSYETKSVTEIADSDTEDGIFEEFEDIEGLEENEEDLLSENRDIDIDIDALEDVKKIIEETQTEPSE